MKRNLLTPTLVLAICILMVPIQTKALTTHTVVNNVFLQNALTAAQNNGDDDIIYVDSSGVYDIADTLVFSTSESFFLKIEGQGTGRPRLSGLGTTQILNIDSTTATNVTITGLLFINGNSATTGGGLFVSTQGIVGIDNCIFSENSALWNGGGAYISSTNITNIEDNRFENNTGDRGGGIFINSGFGASLVVNRNRFSRNAASYGGGAYISVPDAGQGVISNNFFSMNSTNPKGQAGYNLYVFGTSSFFPIPFTLVNNSFAGSYESADSSGTGVHIQSGGGVTVDIYNNIMWHGGLLGTDLAIIEEPGMGGTFANVVNNGFSDLSRVTVTLLLSGNYFNDNNISLPLPKFIDMLGGNLHLQSDSPAIDMGNNDAPYRPPVDIDGDTRIINGIVDLGADEVVVSVPNIAVNPVSYDFEDVSVGDSPVLVVNVRNDGTGDLIIQEVAVADPIGPPFTMDDQCSEKTIPSGSGCTIGIMFSPIELGDFTESFEISSNDADNPTVTVSLSGEGIPPGPTIDINVEPSAVSFDLQLIERYENHQVVVTNTGTTYVDIGQISFSIPQPNPFYLPADYDFCSRASLNPNDSCEFTVVFHSYIWGISDNSLDIPFSNPVVGEDSKTIIVDGTAFTTYGARVEAVPLIDFGIEREEGGSGYATLTITNSGLAGLKIWDIQIIDPNSSIFTIVNYYSCWDWEVSPEIPFLSQCQIYIQYGVPWDESPGLKEAVLEIYSNDERSPHSVDIQVQYNPNPSGCLGWPSGSSATAATSRPTVSVRSFWSEISNANWFIFAVTFLVLNRRLKRRRRE